MKLLHCIFLLTALFIGINEASAQRAKDGNYTATGAGEVLNTYTSVTASVAAGATTATVSNINDLDDPIGTIYNSTTLEQGDLVMIIQMYGADVDIYTWYVEEGWGPYTVPTSYNWYQVHPGFWGVGTETFGQVEAYNQAGKYEVLEVLSVAGNTITFTCPTINSYDHQNTLTTDHPTNNFTASFDNGLQIVRIPRFDNLTVNGGASIVPNQWDGQTGGIVALEVDGTLDIQGTISSSGFGFRGGELDPGPSLTGQNSVGNAARFLGTSDPAQGSERGESIFGWHNQTDFLYSRWGRGAVANSGAGGGYQNCGGGGGSNVENSGLSYDGRGRPDPAYAAAWALDSEPGEDLDFPWPRTTPNSSGGGRGGYALSEADRNELVEGPDIIQWNGDTRKSNGGLGGHPLTYDNTRMFFGGGGGAGDWDSQYGGIPQGGAGGNGGGIVFIQSYGTITGNGTIESNGADGGKTNPANANPPGGFSNEKCGNDGAGGGGAGGWIHIENATALPATLNLTANGGNGGDQDIRFAAFASSEAGGPGGAGSGGAIEYTAGAPTESVVSGVNGLTTSPDVANFEPNGATNGNSGMSGLTAPYYDLVGTGATICVGQTANISVAVLGALPIGATNADITWYTTEYGNNPAPGANTGLTYTTPALAATTTYYVGLCPGTFRIPVTVIVGGAANLVITDPAPVCSPGTVDLTDPAVTAGSDPGTLTYWTDAGATSTLASPGIVGTSGTYYIQLDAGGGCTDIQPVNVTITPAPTLIITDPAAVCSPGTVDLTAGAVTAGSGAGTLTYWTDAGATSTLATPAAVGTTGTYYIQLDAGGGCIDIQPVNVTVNAQPNLVITDPAAVCSPNTVDLTAAAVTAGSDAGTLTYWTDAGATSMLASPGTVGTTGTYYIQLEDGNTCTDIQPVNVTVTSSPNLVITDPAAVCSPGTVDLTAAAVTAGSDPGTLTYWTDAGATSTLASPGTVGTTGTYYIQLEDGNTCTDIQPVNVTVTSSPNLVITDPAAVCSPGTVDLTAAAVTAGSDVGTLTYWTDAGATSTLASPGTVGTTGTYYIQLDLGGGCAVVEPVNVTVNAQPNLVITDPAAVCSSGTVDLTVGAVTAGSDAGTLTYWTDAGATSTLPGPGTVGTTGTYYIQLEDANTCTTVQPVNATINAQPNLVITDPAAVCSPNTVDLIAGVVTAGSDAGTLTYWTDAGATSTLATPGAVGTTGTYYIQLEDANTCTTVQPVNATINAQPNLVITDPAAVCSPGTVDLTAGAVTAGSDAGTLTYWTDAGATSTLATPGAVGTTGTYYIQLEDGNTCTAVQPVNVTVTNNPTLTITDPAAACSPATVDLTDAAVTAGSDVGTLTYWTDAGATSTLATPGTVGTSGTYYIQLEIGGGCTVIQPVNVTINTQPNLVITDPAAVCSPGTVDITSGAVTAGSDVGTLTYWTDAGATSALVAPGTVGTTGTYYIQLEDANTCTDAQAVNVTITPLDDASFNLIPECEGASAIITGLSGGSFMFFVAPTDGALLDASTGYITNATGGTTYSVEYMTNGTCPNSSLEQVIALDCTQDTIVVPTAITPNGDLVNDKWDIQNLDNAYPNNTVTIYNRWGNMIFQHNSSPTSQYSDNMWDGTHNNEPLPVGSYFYVIEFNDGSGESENGTVTIVLNK
jgi:gliding motility-associated-like protein